MKRILINTLLLTAIMFGCSRAVAAGNGAANSSREMVVADEALCAKLYEQVDSPVCDSLKKFLGEVAAAKMTVIGLPDMSTGGTQASIFYINGAPKIINILSYGELGVETDNFYVVDDRTIYIAVRLDFDNEKFKKEADEDQLSFVPYTPWFLAFVFTDGKLVKSYSEQASGEGGHPAVPDDLVSGLLDKYKMALSEAKKRK